MNNIFQNPTVRLVIVVTIVTAISIGIVFIIRGLLTNDLDCKDGTTPSPDGTKCWPKCDKGYKNDSETGKCILDCPDGQVPIKDIDAGAAGLNRCVQPCSDSYCDITKDPDSVCVIKSDGYGCQKPNCYTTDKKRSYCSPAGNCGIGSDGKPDGSYPEGSTFDKAGCVITTGTTCKPGQSSMTSKTAKPYTICCDSPNVPLRNDTTGDVACCPNPTDIVYGRELCCPKGKYCTWKVDGQTKAGCADSTEVCVPDGGPCPIEYATYTLTNGKKKYTGCCPSPVVDGKCKNLCKFKSSNMKSDCITSADCVGDKGETGVCNIKGKCVLACGGVEDKLVCLNDTPNGVSECYDDSKACNFAEPVATNGGVTDKGIYFCRDSVSTAPTPSYAWGGTDDRWQFTAASTFDPSKSGCNKLSCLNKFATDGLLSANISKTTSTDKRQIDFNYPKNFDMSLSDTERLCSATVNCNKMQITDTSSGTIIWNDQEPPSQLRSIKILKNDDANYDGKWTGGDKDRCNPSTSVSKCKYLSDKTYAINGTYDGLSKSLSEISGPLSGEGCQPADMTFDSKPAMNSVYKNNVLCRVKTKLADEGVSITPEYFCPARGICCGYAALPGSTYDTLKNCTPFQAGSKITDSNYVWSAVNGWGESRAIVFKYEWAELGDNTKLVNKLQPINILNISDSYNTIPQTYRWKMASSYNEIIALWSNAIVIMKSVNKDKYINFTKKTGDSSDGVLRLTSDAKSTINFYYSMVDFSGGESVGTVWGQIPLLNGMLRWGKSTDFADYDGINRKQVNIDVGRPVRVTENGSAELDADYMKHFVKPLDKNGFVTIVKFDNIYYLAMVSIWWQKKGIDQQLFGNEKIYYASESDDEAILFNVEGTPGKKPPDGAMEITLETVLSYNKDKINLGQVDDQMLTTLNVRDLIFRITGCNLSQGICKPTTKTNLPTIKEILDDLKQSVN